MNESQMKKRTLTFWILDFGFWIESQHGGWIYERIPDEKKNPHILDLGSRILDLKATSNPQSAIERGGDQWMKLK